LRQGDWKLIVHQQKTDRKVELFNLAEDPSEMKNQSDKQPERVQRLLKKMDEMSIRDRDAVAKD
jgi:arylsulfatase A-like enzyme